MSFLAWIENSAFADYILVSTYGYAIMITLHSLGLAIMVGLSLVLSLRALGYFTRIPYASLAEFLKVAWIGFIVNIISGGSLFASRATSYITDFEFLLKMFFVVLGAIFVALLQGAVSQAIAVGGGAVTQKSTAKFYAIATIVSWTGAMITGRLIAYL